MAVDKLYKCISTQTCYDKMIEMRQRIRDIEKWKHAVSMEFQNRSIMANWGANKIYIVSAVDFSTPVSECKFMREGSEINVAQYFSQLYNLNVSDMD